MRKYASISEIFLTIVFKTKNFAAVSFRSEQLFSRILLFEKAKSDFSRFFHDFDPQMRGRGEVGVAYFGVVGKSIPDSLIPVH